MSFFENRVKGHIFLSFWKDSIYAKNQDFENYSTLWTICTCDNIEAGLVEGAHEQLESDDGVDDDDEEDEEGDVHQGDDRHQDGIHHNLQTWKRSGLNIRPRREASHLARRRSVWGGAKPWKLEGPSRQNPQFVKLLKLNWPTWKEFDSSTSIVVKCVTPGLINHVVCPCVPSPFD